MAECKVAENPDCKVSDSDTNGYEKHQCLIYTVAFKLCCFVLPVDKTHSDEEGSHWRTAPKKQRRSVSLPSWRAEPQLLQTMSADPPPPSPTYSPVSPSPEPLSPILKPRECGSATYR